MPTPTPHQGYNWLMNALARGGVPKEVIQTISNPGRLPTDAIGQFNRIVSDTGKSAQATARNLTGAVQQAVAQSRGVNPQNPIRGFNINSANPLGRGITAPTIGTSNPRSIIKPTISGPAPNTFGAPYIRDPALARQFMQGGLPRNVPRSPVPGTTKPIGFMGNLGTGINFLSAALTGAQLGAMAGEGGANYIIQNHPETAKQIQNALFQIPGLRDYRDSVKAQNQTGTTAFNKALPRVVRFPEDYQRTELKAGSDAEQFRPGAGFPGQQAFLSPEQQIQSEQWKRGLDAPVTTTPEVPGQQAGNAGAMQEYMALKAKAKTPEDYQVLDELGMRIHQEKYGTPEQRKAETIGTFNPLLAQMGLPQPAQGAINFNLSTAFGNQMPGVNVSPYSGAYVPPVSNIPQFNPTNPSYGYQGIPSLGDQTNIGLPEDQKDKAQEFLRRLSKFGGSTK